MSPREQRQVEPVTPDTGVGEPMTLIERREVFKRMVRDELVAGTLTYSRRERLLRYAEQIGINATHANLLIYDARREADVEPLAAPRSLTARLGRAGPLTLWQWLQLAVAIAAAVAVHLILRHFLR